MKCVCEKRENLSVGPEKICATRKCAPGVIANAHCQLGNREFRLCENDKLPKGDKGPSDEVPIGLSKDVTLQTMSYAGRRSKRNCVCESVVITRIQLLRNLFERIRAMLWSSKQCNVKRLKNCAAQYIIESLPAGPDTRVGAHVLGACMMEKVCCKATKSRCTLSAGTVGTVRGSGDEM
jgi:hypothetical protein